MKNTIKVNITKVARRKCGRFTSNCSCLLATSIKRTNQFNSVSVSYMHAELDNVIYKFPIRIARRIHNAYGKPKSHFKPFTVTLQRSLCT